MESCMQKYLKHPALLAVVVLAMLAAAVAGATEKQLHFGFATREVSAPFFRAMILAAERKAEELGVKLTILSSNNDNLDYLAIIENFIAQKIDGFLFGAPIDPTALIPGIKRMNKEGIPIIGLDIAPTGGKINYFINFDIYGSSVKAAEVMVAELKRRHASQVPQGVVIEVMGDLLEGWADISTAGFHSVIDAYSQLRVVQGSGNWNNHDSYRVVYDYMTRFGNDVVAMFVHTPDIMGVGAVNAIKHVGQDPARIVSTGLCIGPEGIELLKRKEFYAIVEQPVYTAGEMAVELLYKLAKGQPVPRIGDVLGQEDDFWYPARVVKHPYFVEGAYIKLSAPMVPIDVPIDDPRLWENRVFGSR